MSILKELGVPVFKAEGIPRIDEKGYLLSLRGSLEKELDFSLPAIKRMPFSQVNARLTSVSGWSVRALWEGVLWQDFFPELNVLPAATHVTFRSYGGYTTCVALEDLQHPRVLLSYSVHGEVLEREYGGPLRMIVPHLWGYKSCKWLQEIKFTTAQEGGYWENRGYSETGEIKKGKTFDVNSGQYRSIGGGEVLDF